MIRWTVTVTLLAALGAASTFAQTLNVDIKGIQHDRGRLHVDLFIQPGTFRKEAEAFQVQRVAAKSGTVMVSFTGLQPGIYAVMAYHDEDGNGELNRRLGMFPLEGYGLSRNPEVIGPPSFEECAFKLGDSAVSRISIDMRY